MRKIIIDTNILFSALYTKNRNLRNILTIEDYEFYAPSYLFVELFKHKERLMSKSNAEEEEVYEILHLFLQHIHFVSEQSIAIENFAEAFRLCKDTDENDMLFVALALELNAQLWTRDEKLKNGLKSKGFNLFFENK